MSVRPRNFVSLAVAFGVAWAGGLILGEYPFDGALPILGGFLMGVSVVGAAAWVETWMGGEDDPPPWVVVLCAGLAVWGIFRAASFDVGAQGEILGLIPKNRLAPLPSVANYAMGAAAIGALVRLIPKPASRRRRAEPESESAEDDEEGDETWDDDDVDVEDDEVWDDVDEDEDEDDEPETEPPANPTRRRR